MQYQLAMIMPVYNESECIAGVLNSWIATLSGLDISFKIIALNDGSTDNTAEVLKPYESRAEVQIVNKANSGHGPTILTGYKTAAELADWVFQCDSDDEMKSEHFPKLWEIRDEHDAIFGARAGREQNMGRSLISIVSRFTIKIFFGSKVQDVNTPYRLMRAKYLKRIVEQIPADTFAPNLVISGAFSRSKLRVTNLQVPHEGRQTGSVSIVKWKLWKAAARSFLQTLRLRHITVEAE